METKFKLSDNLVVYYNSYGNIVLVEKPLDDISIHIVGDIIRYFKGNAIHRDNDLPAIIKKGEGCSTRYWYQNGLPHRDNGPAMIYSDGTELWFERGKEIGREIKDDN